MAKVLALLSLFFTFLFCVPRAMAQNQGEASYSIGTVSMITEQTEIPRDGEVYYTQKVLVAEKGTVRLIPIEVGSPTIPLSKEQLYHTGQSVVIVSDQAPDGTQQFSIADQYRIPTLIALAVAFVLIVVLVSWAKGILSLLGMIVSLGVLVFYMVPQILSGGNPIVISIIASGMISALIIYLGHGINYRSHIALFCMLATLGLVAISSYFVVRMAYLTGIGDETASYLQLPGIKPINLQGLLLGGIILAALSVLDDSVVSQVSVIYQLKSVKKDISMKELWSRGMSVGRDHISTLVNTLILAYAGASLPLFILLTVNPTGQPLWYALNQQTIAEEIVRTLTGSIGLVLSIPLTTFIAAYVIQKQPLPRVSKTIHVH
jgi:uncharacterized membrane protein